MPTPRKSLLLTVQDASELLGVSKQTVRKWVDEGRAKAARLPPRGDRRFTPEEIARIKRDVMGLEE